MKFTPFRWLAGIFLLANCVLAGDFSVQGDKFMLDGQPFQIRSGEIHYPRVPGEAWRERIAMAKAMGLNTISTYVFWNLHETERGSFDFEGDRDVAVFLKACQEEGMRAIVRPGPYVCAEWDLGGIPAWVIAEPGVKVRSTDPRYLEPAKAWMKRMGEMLQPLSVTQGGPVLMVQLENEFGNFEAAPGYLEELERALRSGGYTGTVFTGDGASEKNLNAGSRPGMLKAVNFGGAAESAFGNLERVNPGGPKFTSEFWVGWFDQWERPHHLVSSQEKLGDLEWMMATGASFNLYMFHGGTTRGLWSGANWEGGYRPTTDCYDYSAPLEESGRPTEKYRAFRHVITRALKDEKIPEVPKLPTTGSIGTLEFTEQCRLRDGLPKGHESAGLKTMESFGQATGFILYRTTVEGPLEGNLELGTVKDRVQVMLDGELLGISGRSTGTATIAMKVPAGSHRLDLMVENMGRVNFGKAMNDERKGLEAPVLLGDRELGPFEHILLSMQSPPAGTFRKIEKEGPKEPRDAATLYRAKFKIGTPCDTWLDTRDFGRGIVWLNGRNLGRYWKAGPPQSVFIPGCWIKKGEENELVILELEKADCPLRIPTSAMAIWGNGR